MARKAATIFIFWRWWKSSEGWWSVQLWYLDCDLGDFAWTKHSEISDCHMDHWWLRKYFSGKDIHRPLLAFWQHIMPFFCQMCRSWTGITSCYTLYILHVSFSCDGSCITNGIREPINISKQLQPPNSLSLSLFLFFFLKLAFHTESRRAISTVFKQRALALGKDRQRNTHKKMQYKNRKKTPNTQIALISKQTTKSSHNLN